MVPRLCDFALLPVLGRRTDPGIIAQDPVIESAGLAVAELVRRGSLITVPPRPPPIVPAYFFLRPSRANQRARTFFKARKIVGATA